MKRAGRKIVGVVACDYQVARIVDRAAVDIVSVGDSVGVNVWGREDEADVTLEEMILICKAVRRGVARALVGCDLPAGAHEVQAARSSWFRLATTVCQTAAPVLRFGTNASSGLATAVASTDYTDCR
jgi:ketopantoate hydroxymethyltransferase